MTTDIGYPATPGLAHAVERVGKAYDNAEKRQSDSAKRAALNAAAPDLLAALTAVLEVVRDARGDQDCDGMSQLGGYIFGDVMSDAIDDAEKAIAKATGAATVEQEFPSLSLDNMSRETPWQNEE
jgi:hypothetical protein